MHGTGRRLSEEEARRILRRAAELQLRAADSAARETLPVPVERKEGLAPAEVTSAAVEAGIAAEHVQQALAELEVERDLPGLGKGLQRYGSVVVGKPFDAIEVERTIPGDPADVYASLQRIFLAPPFNLVLSDSIGTDPLVDGVLVFDVERSGFSGTQFQSRLHIGDVSRLYVTLREAPGGCRVQIRAPLEKRRLNVFLSSLFTTVSGGAGFAIGAGIAATALPVIAVPIATGALFATGGAFGFRGIYRACVRNARRALDQLLGALTADAQLGVSGTGNAFPPLPPKEET
jgi:hypothetical protein